MNEKKKDLHDPVKEIADEAMGAAARFGREAKIGVAVILTLLIVLGVVVVRRLTAPKPDEVAVNAPADPSQEKAAEQNIANGGSEQSPGDSHLGDSKDVKSDAFPPGQATILKPNAASTNPRKSSASDQDLFLFPPDKSDKSALPDKTPRAERKLAVGDRPSSSRSFMPDPPKPQTTSLSQVSKPNKTSIPATPTSDVFSAATQPALPADPNDRYAQQSQSSEATTAAGDDRYATRSESSHAALPSQDAATSATDTIGVNPSASGVPTSDVESVAASPADPSGIAPSSAEAGAPYRPAIDAKEVAANDYPPAQVAAAGAAFSAKTRYGDAQASPSEESGSRPLRAESRSDPTAAMAEHNRAKGFEENQLPPGNVVETPQSKATTVSTRQDSSSGRVYTVTEGDTLFNIARYELGKASRWGELYDLNRDILGKDFNYLKPGTQLILPQDEKGGLQARRPKDEIRR